MEGQTTRERLTLKNHRRLRQRGNAILEAALILNVFFMLLFALIDFSVAVLMKNCVTSAVRDGVRAGITGGAPDGHLNDNIKSVVEQDSMNFVSDAMITITYLDPNTMAPVTGETSAAAGNILEVSVSGLSWAWMCPYARNASALQISATSADVMEPTSSGVIPTI
jgi:Flp pilus assembly protein TadG